MAINKKLIISVMMVKMMSIQLGSYSFGMYILGITHNMWIASVPWAIGSYINWCIFEKYMREMTMPKQWIEPMERPLRSKL